MIHSLVGHHSNPAIHGNVEKSRTTEKNLRRDPNNRSQRLYVARAGNFKLLACTHNTIIRIPTCKQSELLNDTNYSIV